MNKTELVAAIAEKVGLSQVQTNKVISAFEDVVADQLKNGEPVTMLGFGTFTAKAREARIGRNPNTGEAVQIKASKGISFKAGKNFKEQVNG